MLGVMATASLHPADPLWPWSLLLCVTSGSSPNVSEPQFHLWTGGATRLARLPQGGQTLRSHGGPVV